MSTADHRHWVPVDPQPAFPAHVAAPGTIYVCGACGKMARDKYDGPGGWDESCMLNAVLCWESVEDKVAVQMAKETPDEHR